MNLEEDELAVDNFRSKVEIAEDAVVLVNPNIYVVLTAVEGRQLLTILERFYAP